MADDVSSKTGATKPAKQSLFGIWSLALGVLTILAWGVGIWLLPECLYSCGGATGRIFGISAVMSIVAPIMGIALGFLGMLQADRKKGAAIAGLILCASPMLLILLMRLFTAFF